MVCDYGFNSIGNQLVDECRKPNADFDIITSLLEQMDEINMASEDGEENILSEIIVGYPKFFVDEHCNDCQQNGCLGSEYQPQEADGKNLPKIIKLFLEYGFDVNANNGAFGGMCFKIFHGQATTNTFWMQQNYY